MGNCWTRCCGKYERRKYLRTRYSVERDYSIEFENLMDDDTHQEEMNRPVTDHEKQLLLAKQYGAIVHEQKRIDAEIDAKLARQEDELRLEEEAYYEAKREASRINKLQRAKETTNRNRYAPHESRSWLGDNEHEWDVAGGGEDDFEMFLASVKARSLSARTNIRKGSADGQSSSSSTTQTRDKSHTEASSLDLEWEHEAGMVPQAKHRSPTEENLTNFSTKSAESPIAFSVRSTDSPVNDLEWDNDYNNSQHKEKEQLLSRDKKSYVATER